MTAAPPTAHPARRAHLRRFVVLISGLVLMAGTACSSADDDASADPRPVVATGEPTGSTTGSITGSVDSPVVGSAVPTTAAPSETTPARPGADAPAEPPATVPMPAGAELTRGNTVLIVGDSVILAAKPQLPGALAGWQVTVDAQESRFPTVAPAILRAARTSGRLASVVAIHLCNNYSRGGGFARLLDVAMAELDGVARVVWVTCAERTPGQTEANAAIRAAATRHRNVVIADWAGPSRTPSYTYADGLHLRPPGQHALAAVIAGAIGSAPA